MVKNKSDKSPKSKFSNTFWRRIFSHFKVRNWKNCLHLIIKDSIPLAFGGGAAIPTISVNSPFGLPSTCSPSVRAWALSIGA